MVNEANKFGNIHVSPRAIATIAYQAAVESYGVVGLAFKNLLYGLSNLVVKDPSHGIEVNYKDGKIYIDLYIVVEYGTNIRSVAKSVANTVRFHVEKALGIPLAEVNVHVQGMRVSQEY